MNFYEGSSLKIIDSIEYKFSIFLGNETGYSHLDAFYKVPYDKISNLIEKVYQNFSIELLII